MRTRKFEKYRDKTLERNLNEKGKKNYNEMKALSESDRERRRMYKCGRDTRTVKERGRVINVLATKHR